MKHDDEEQINNLIKDNVNSVERRELKIAEQTAEIGKLKKRIRRLVRKKKKK